MMESQQPTLNYQHWFAGGDIFYRQTDRQHLEDAVDALVSGERGLAVIANHETPLDHYARMLLTRLRERKAFQLEVLLPTDTESLLQRFNDLMAAVSLEQATEHAASSTPAKLLVISDPKLVKDDQWALIERLLSDFPGINLRLILLINKTGYADYQRPLDLLGRKLHRWLLEMPSAQEAQQLLQAARQQGYASEVETLLLQTGLGVAVGLSKAPTETDHNPTSIESVAESAIQADAETNPEPTCDPSLHDANLQSTEGSNPRARLGMALILIMAIAAVAWQLTARLNQPVAVTTELQIVAQPHGLPLAENILAPPPESIQYAYTRPQQQNPQPMADGANLSGEIAVAENAPAALSVEPQAQQEAQGIDQLKAQPRSTGQAPVTAIDIVNNSDPDDFFVQHIVLSDRDQAVKFTQRYPQLRQALLLPIKTQQTVGIAVLSGPFESRPLAEQFAKDSSVSADYWIRGAGQLRIALVTE
jgi:hypothetical protein